MEYRIVWISKQWDQIWTNQSTQMHSTAPSLNSRSEVTLWVEGWREGDIPAVAVSPQTEWPVEAATVPFRRSRISITSTICDSPNSLRLETSSTAVCDERVLWYEGYPRGKWNEKSKMSWALKMLNILVLIWNLGVKENFMIFYDRFTKHLGMEGVSLSRGVYRELRNPKKVTFFLFKKFHVYCTKSALKIICSSFL